MNRRTILLAEDNPEEAVLTMHALDCGHLLDEVIIAGDGQECLDYLFGAGRFAGRDIRSMPALNLLEFNIIPSDSGNRRAALSPADAQAR